MQTKFGVSPDACCVIDGLSRANQLEDGENYLNQILAPHVPAFMAVLSGCRIFSDYYRAYW
jgi:hypothetical protein